MEDLKIFMSLWKDGPSFLAIIFFIVWIINKYKMLDKLTEKLNINLKNKRKISRKKLDKLIKEHKVFNLFEDVIKVDINELSYSNKSFNSLAFLTVLKRKFIVVKEDTVEFIQNLDLEKQDKDAFIRESIIHIQDLVDKINKDWNDCDIPADLCNLFNTWHEPHVEQMKLQIKSSMRRSPDYEKEIDEYLNCLFFIMALTFGEGEDIAKNANILFNGNVSKYECEYLQKFKKIIKINSLKF